MPPHTFLFDLGNVLVHFSHERMCSQLAAASGLPHERMRGLLFDDGLQHGLETGAISAGEFHRRLQVAAAAEIEFELLCRAGADIFQLNGPMLPILDALKSRGHRLVLLSNTCESHFEWVRTQWDVLDRFDDFVLSCRVGAVKPEPEIFVAALAAIDCAPAECFYTDDIPAYVVTGCEFGLDAEVFTDAASLVRQLADRGISVV